MIRILAVSAVALTLAGCGTTPVTRTASGAMIGAGSGALAGSMIAGSTGAVVGGIGGAAAGAVIGAGY